MISDSDARSDLERYQFAYLTTVGRSTHRPHRIEIWFVADDAHMHVIAGGQRRSDWVKNLVANPSVTVEIGDRRWESTATFLDDAKDHPARERLAERYQGWRRGEPLTEWATNGLLIQIGLGNGT
jgi:deazaflavin-dependent oxidoreductase (nitroreductase family)